MLPKQQTEGNTDSQQKTGSVFLIYAALFIVLAFATVGHLTGKTSTSDVTKAAKSKDLKAGDFMVEFAMLTKIAFSDLKNHNEAASISKAYSKCLADPDCALRAAIVHFLFGEDEKAVEKHLAGAENKGDWQEILGVSKFNPERSRAYNTLVKKSNLGPLEYPLLAAISSKAGNQSAAENLILQAHKRAVGALVRLVSVFATLGFLLIGGVVFLIVGAADLKRLPELELVISNSNIVFFVRYLVVFALASLVAKYIMGNVAESALIYALVMLGIEVACFTQLNLRELPQRFENCKCSLRSIGLGIAGASAALPIYILAALASFVLFKNNSPQANFVPYLTAGGLPSVIMVFVVVFIGPFVEEVAFRGLLLDALMEKMSFWQAATISSAAFAILHLDIYFKFVPIFFFALILCYLRRKTNSLTTSYIAHAANNALMLAMVFAY